MELNWNMITTCTPYLISMLNLLLLLEQISYLKKKRFLPGPTLVLPFVGNVFPLVLNPSKFWALQSSNAKSTPLGVSANYLIGRYMVYIYSTDLSHKILANVRPDAFHLVGHPFAKKLFGEHNLIYMFGQDHKDLRRQFAPSFTPRALQIYTPIHQRIMLKHLASWPIYSRGESVPLRHLCRDLNLEASQTVFLGNYLDEDSRRRIKVEFDVFNLGFTTLPIDLPGFTFRKARLAVQRVVQTLTAVVEASHKRMESGGEPTCVVDFWMLEIIRLSSEINPVEYSYRGIAGHLFDFLFAAQDASTSALMWAVTMLDSHPHVLEKVRKEVESHWRPGSGATITGEQLVEMNYTEAVAREVLRIRAPALVIPHIAGADIPLTESYVIPKGTMVFPSVFDSSFQGFTEPEKFDPDRFLEDRQEDRVYKKNYLVFGAGAHQCVGQRYAFHNLKVFIAMFACLFDFKRDRTEGCDEIAFIPSTAPKDDCMVFLSQRFDRFPSV